MFFQSYGINSSYHQIIFYAIIPRSPPSILGNLVTGTQLNWIVLMTLVDTPTICNKSHAIQVTTTTIYSALMPG